MTFEEADRRYAGLKRRHENGALSDEEFDAQLKDLLVKDEEGRWWSKSARTGEWYRRTVSGDWVKDFPPPPYKIQDPHPPPPNGRNWWRVLFLVFGVVALLAVLAYVVYSLVDRRPPAPAVAVPDLVGMKLDEAENRYSNKVDIRVERWVESKEPVHTIRRQDPEGGKVKKGSTIEVNVVQTQMADVPGVGGKEADEARKMLEDAKFNVAEDEEQSSSGAEGSVVDQNPAGGTTVEVGSEVTITVGTGPPEPTTTVGTTTGTTGTTTGGTPSPVVFEDDFSSAGSRWAEGNFGQYSDGGYVLSTGDQRFAWVTSPAGLFEDTTVEVDAKDVTVGPTGSNYWGIACRMRGNRYYDFGISNTGQYLITKRYGDGSFEVIQDDDSSEAFDPRKTNHISAWCVGNTLTLQVNGQTLLEATDTEFSSGEVGLYAEDYVPDPDTTTDAPGSVEVRFDNFKVSRP